MTQHTFIHINYYYRHLIITVLNQNIYNEQQNHMISSHACSFVNAECKINNTNLALLKFSIIKFNLAPIVHI